MTIQTIFKAIGLLCAVIVVSGHLFGRNPGDQPNIVLIMADDIGYECISANGSEDYQTPVIDKLAAEGVRFEHCFANPVCTPSRVKIMTGQYNKRNYVKFGVLDRSQVTFAHQLKQIGYATVIAGKWQLGDEVDSPKHFGFDEACMWQHTRKKLKEGTKFDSRYPNPCLEINGVEVDYTNGEYGPDVCADFICDFIETNKDQPFLVYYPMILTHCPFDATPDSATWDPKSPGSPIYKGEGEYEELKSHFKDMVHYSDKIVGKIVAKLEALGLRDNTLIIFTGDNGTDEPIVTNWSGREVVGGKRQLEDTGTRVPLVVNWPGMISPKLDTEELVEFSDIMPTLCELTGAPLPENYPQDGVSLWPTLSGAGERVKDNIYIWYKGKTWVRTKEHGVLYDSKSEQYRYQAFEGHFSSQMVNLKDVSEAENRVFTQLKAVIDDMATVEGLEAKAGKGSKKKQKKKANNS